MSNKQINSYTILRLIAASVLCMSYGATVQAAILDLSTAGTSGSINGALFYEASDVAWGGGTAVEYATFQRLGNSTSPTGVSHGYNTDGVDQYDNASANNFSIHLSAVPTFTINGTIYREFVFDANETKGAATQLLSLDKIEIYISNSSTLTGHSDLTGFGSAANLVFDLDTGPDGDSWIKLDGGGGSGSRDILMYIDDTLFTNNAVDGVADPYLHIYSMVGSEGDDPKSKTYNGLGNDGNGKESWAHAPNGVAVGPPVPLPPAVWLFGSGLVGLFSYSKRKKLAS